MNPLSRAALRHPIRTLAAVALLTAAAAPGLGRLELRTDGQALVPPRAAAVVYDRAIRRRFGIRDPMVVVVRTGRPEGIFNPETLRRVRDLTAELARLPGIGPAGVTSLATEQGFRFVPGTLRHRTFLDPLPESPADLAELRSDLARIGVYDGVLIGAGGKAAAVVVGVPPGADRQALYRQVRAIAASGGGVDHVEVLGAPVAETLLGSHILADLGLPASWLGAGAEEPGRRIGLVPASLAMMGLVFLIGFRRPAAAVWPLAKVGICLTLVFGAMGWLGVPVYLTTAVLPVLLLAVGTASEVHLFRRFGALRAGRPGAAGGELAAAAVGEVEAPVMQAAATTAVGFLSFSLSSIGPVRVFGLAAGAGVLLCLLGSLAATPAVLALVPPGWIAGRRAGIRIEGGVFRRIAPFAVRHRRAVLVVAAAVALLALDGVRRVVVQDSWVDGFAPESDFARAMRQFDRDFAGAHVLQVVVEAEPIHRAGDVAGTELGDRTLTLAALPGVAAPQLLGSFLEVEGPRGADPPRQPRQWSSWVATARPEGDRVVLGWPLTGGSPRIWLAPSPTDRVGWTLRREPLAVPAVLDKARELERFLATRSGVGGVLGPARFLETASFLTSPDDPGARHLPESPEAAEILWHNAGVVLGREKLGRVVDADRARGLVTVFLRGSNFAGTGRLMAGLRSFEHRVLVPAGIRLGFAGDVAVSQALIGAVVTTQVESLALSLVGIFAVTAWLARSGRRGRLCVVPAAFAVLLDFAAMGWLGIPLGVATSMFAGMTLGVGVDYAIHLLARAERTSQSEALAATGPAILIDSTSSILGFAVLLLSQVPANHRLGGLLSLSLGVCVLATLWVVPALAFRASAVAPVTPTAPGAGPAGVRRVGSLSGAASAPASRRG